MWMTYDFCYGNSSYRPKDLEHYLEFRRMCKFYLSWVLPLIIIVGILGSVFCLLFLLFSKLFPKNLLLWLVSICVADLMILLLDGLWMLLKMWVGFDIRDVNNFFCISHKFLSNYFFYWSAYMQTMVSIQRAYLIMRPLQARTALVLPRLIIVWVALSVLLIIPHLIYVVRWRVRDGDCDPEKTSDFYVTTLCDLIIWAIIPFVAMVISTCIICINVCTFQSRAFTQRLSTPKVVYSFVKNNPSTFIGQTQALNLSESSSLNKKSLRINAKMSIGHEGSPEYLSQNYVSPGRRHGGVDTAKHVTQLLIGMNLWYMLTTFPLLIFLIYLNFIDPNINSWRRKFLYYLLRSFSFYNACSNWIFYCAAGRLFRTTAKQILIKLVCSKCISTNYSTNSQGSAILGVTNKIITNPKKTFIP